MRCLDVNVEAMILNLHQCLKIRVTRTTAWSSPARHEEEGRKQVVAR